MEFSEHHDSPRADTTSSEGLSPFAVLRKRWLIVVLITLLTGAAAAAFAYANRDTYESTAKLVFRQTISPELNAIGLLPSTQDAKNLAQDNAEFVDSRAIAVVTSRDLRAQGIALTPADVDRDVTVVGSKDSDVVAVTASATSPQRAAIVANAYANAAARASLDIQRGQAGRALANLNKQLAALSRKQRNTGFGPALRSRIVAVRALVAVGNGSPQVLQPGYVPTAKSGNPIQTIVLGLLFGLVLGAGAALLREQADRRLHQPEELSAAFDAPVLTTVPRRRALGRNAKFADLPPEVTEAFRMLHTNLRHTQTGPVRSVVITSSRSGEGKTTVAWNLACAAVSGGVSVAIVEADLRRPALSQRYGVAPVPGLGDVLLGAVSLADAVQQIDAPTTKGADGHQRRLDVLTSGDPGPDPWALMQSDAIGRLLDDLKRDHDLVIVDTPPIPHVADAISLLRHVDGVIVTASVNSTRGPAAIRLRDQLQGLDARILGVVAVGGSPVSGYAYAPRPVAAAPGNGGPPGITAGRPGAQGYGD